MQTRPRGEMDITSDFGSDVPGSNPGEGTGNENGGHGSIPSEAGMVQW